MDLSDVKVFGARLGDVPVGTAPGCAWEWAGLADAHAIPGHTLEEVCRAPKYGVAALRSWCSCGWSRVTSPSDLLPADLLDDVSTEMLAVVAWRSHAVDAAARERGRTRRR